MMLPADPLTRLATLATLSPKGGRRVIGKSYTGQDTSSELYLLVQFIRCRCFARGYRHPGLAGFFDLL